MKLSDQLFDASKRKILTRWKSIKYHAERNMAYGHEGSYSTTATLRKDKAMLDVIDQIINETLK